MRWLALGCVHFYRLFLRRWVPALRRRRCLFEESCSAFALRVLRERGFREGVRLAHQRVRACRLPAGASFVLDEQGRARLLAATSGSGEPVPARAIAHLAHLAELAAGAKLAAPAKETAPRGDAK